MYPFQKNPKCMTVYPVILPYETTESYSQKLAITLSPSSAEVKNQQAGDAQAERVWYRARQ